MATAPHCKLYPDHVHALTDTSRATNKVTAHYMQTMQCENHVQTYGVLLNQRAKDPSAGMHLLPESCAHDALPENLRLCASECGPGETVTIVHTYNKLWRHFVTVTPDGAV